MRKELLNKIIDEITLEELVKCQGIKATDMKGKKYYYFIRGKTENVNFATHKEWSKKLSVTNEQLSVVLKNQKEYLKLKEIERINKLRKEIKGL